MAKGQDEPERLSDKLDDERLLRLLAEPLGSAVPITRKDAIAIVQAGIGGRPDLPSGKEYVRRIRRLWRGLLPRD
jgi:hypothetical protein